MATVMIIRTITESDWPEILLIQSSVYPDITPETETVLRSKIALGPETCLTIADNNHHVVGYCLAHPWHDKPACLHTVYSQPSTTELLYIHDIAIAPTHSGQQLGRHILSYLQRWAKDQGYCALSLVSLGQAVSYWLQQGFKPLNHSIDEQQYGDGACYMQKHI
jgi:GNAT superfamily N-acetyltransferase